MVDKQINICFDAYNIAVLPKSFRIFAIVHRGNDKFINSACNYKRSEMNHHISISDYDYNLPEERIAKFPLEQRDSSKLLINNGGHLSQDVFRNIGDHLPEGSLFVFNNTKVIRARLIFHKDSGARIEVFCLEPYDPADYERAFSVKGHCRWKCIIGNLRRWKEGKVFIRFDLNGTQHTLSAERVKEQTTEDCHEIQQHAGSTTNQDVAGGSSAASHIVEFRWDVDMTFGQLLETLGKIPIPPYLNRESQEIDNSRYQTVYSKFEGSVAAPTAGLHFTPELIGRLRDRGFGFDEVTLHVGAGTFLPVKDDDATRHHMHTEHFEITLEALRKLRENRDKIVAVGTTSVRTLESLAALGWRVLNDGNADCERVVGQWEIYDVPDESGPDELLGALERYMTDRGEAKLKAATQIMITGEYRFHIVDSIVTNFHQPKSTLLLLVSAYLGNGWRDMYDYALDNGFRFLSYGDSCLLTGGATRF